MLPHPKAPLKAYRVNHSFYYELGPEYLLASARLVVYFWPLQCGGNAIVKEV
jgi:hypothetical protein